MEIATDQRPAIGTRVRVTFAGSTGYDAETVTGEVAFHYPDGIDVTDPDGYVFTVFDRELSADGRTTLEVL